MFKNQFSNTSKGIFFLLISSLAFALMAVFVRLSGNIFFIQKTFFRNAVSFLIAFITLLIEIKKNGKETISLPKSAVPYLLLRALGGTIGIFGNFYAIDHLVLSDASILNKMSPFFAIIFSFLLIKEKIKLVPFIAVICAFLGSILVVKPSFDFSKMLPTLAGFSGGVGAGLAYACLRKLGLLKCNGKIVILFFSTFSILTSIPYIIFNFEPMTSQQVLFLLCSGVCAAIGQFSITAAYFHSPANKISIYDYSQIIFSALLGFFIFGQIADVYSFIGYIIIVCMAILNFVYNNRKGKLNG